jgi:2-polyprenyl-6-methoxyphenol hydroxylase-like FAD-dependent oxidoreductase
MVTLRREAVDIPRATSTVQRESRSPALLCGQGDPSAGDGIMAERCDMVVIGGGPAGALTALLSARRLRGRSIMLLEAAATPGRKACGEFLSPDGLRILAGAGLEDAVMARGAQRLSGLTLATRRGDLAADYHRLLGRAPFRPYGIGIRREHLDGVLMEAAATVVDVRRGARLIGMERAAQGWRLRIRDAAGEHQLETRLVIGADGRQSLVRHRSGLDRPSSRERFALVCRATGIAHGGHGEMHLGPLGQVGLAPLGEGEVNLNLLLAPAARALLRARPPATLMRAALRATPTLRARTAHARLGAIITTGSLPQDSQAVTADGLALVGDAAGFCDPFTGEGMCLAMQGAERLVDSVVHALALPGSGIVARAALVTYERACAWQRVARQPLGDGLQQLLGRRALAERLIALAGSSRTLSRALVAMTGNYA